MTTSIAQHEDRSSLAANPDFALARLLEQLKARAYHFITPTPASHARVLARRSDGSAHDLRDVLGWSRPFETRILDGELRDTLFAAGALEPLADGRYRSRYRVSSLDGDLFLHSAFPTEAADAVFFGPDSYRFAQLIRAELTRRLPCSAARLVDIGAGAGVGGIVAARLSPGLNVAMADTNPEALRLARVNAAAADVEAECLLGRDLGPVDGPIDIALANPPYIIDGAGREYRDGGDRHGAGVAFQMAAAAVARLAPAGRLILYTGSAIIDGSDALRQSLEDLARRHGCVMRYREIDPDVFGEELEKPEYCDVERIAIVGAVLTRED